MLGIDNSIKLINDHQPAVTAVKSELGAGASFTQLENCPGLTIEVPPTAFRSETHAAWRR